MTGFVDRRLAELEVVREFTEQREYELVVSTLRENLRSDAIMELMNDGRTSTLDQAVDIALRA